MSAITRHPSNGRCVLPPIEWRQGSALQSTAPKDGGSLALTLVGREGAAADQVIATFGELHLGVRHAVISPAGAPFVSPLYVENLRSFKIVEIFRAVLPVILIPGISERDRQAREEEEG